MSGSIAISEEMNLTPFSAKLVTLSLRRKGPAPHESRAVAERVDESRQESRQIDLSSGCMFVPHIRVSAVV